MADTLGSFSVVGPVTYLTDDPSACRALLRGPSPAVRTWFHGTTEHAARLACVQGIAPGCWIGDGSGCCAVMGYDSLDDFLDRRRHLWIVEIVGPALNGDLKAWWVPSHDIRGVWRIDSFVPREEVVRTFNEPLAECRPGCACGLSDICQEQQRLWRSGWADGR